MDGDALAAVGLGLAVWRIDAGTRLEALAGRWQASGGGGAPDGSGGDATRVVDALLAGDAVAALEAYETTVAGGGGEAAAERDRPWAEMMVGLAVLARGAGDLDRAAAALRRLDRAIGDDDPLRLAWRHSRALLLVAAGDLARAEEALAGWWAPRAAPRGEKPDGSLDDPFAGAVMARAAAIVAQAAGAHRVAVGRWRDVIARFEHLGLRLAAASGRQRLAATLALAGEPEIALETALDAVAALDAERYRFTSPMARDAWFVEYLDTIAIAVETSHALGEVTTHAELVERARSQIAKAPQAPQASEASEADERRGRWPAPAITVAGRGGRLAVTAGHDAVVDLDLLRRRLGGDEAWWWGAWRWRDRLHWSLIAPGGAVGSGASDVSGVVVDATDLDQSPDSERAVARRLGAELLPPPLAAAARDAVRRGRRIRVVIAASVALQELPFSIMSIDESAIRAAHRDGADGGADDRADGSPDDRADGSADESANEREDGLAVGSDPMRLVEAADLALAPSAAFLDSLSRLDAGPAPLGLVVADPTGDLPIARRVGVALAERTGATALVGRDATRAALASGLARAGATSSVAIFGHAALPAGGAAHLLLADGALDADEIGMLDRWPPPDQAPRRVLLAACASAGLADLGVGSEWLGLAPAILRAGTATVVATTWPLPEHPAVAELDVQLAELLTTSNDPVAALGDIQRAWLARWRADGWRTSAEQASGAVDPGHASPLLWAGLVVATNGTRG